MVLRRHANLADDESPLDLVSVPEPTPRDGEVLVRVSACGVCRTDLDEIEGRMPPPRLPLVLGHQVVGRVEAVGPGADPTAVGTRVGIAWIHSACGECARCEAGDENLCAGFRATGRDVDGGYAEYATAPQRFVHAIPDEFADAKAAPLLCAGAIGYRALSLTGLHDGQRLGLTGFGASAHLVLKIAAYRFPKTDVFVFARNEVERAFARDLGAAWAGDTEDRPGVELDAVIDTTPAWKPVVEALENLAPGGRLVINAIRKEGADLDYLSRLDYARHLWMEKEIKTVANVTRSDVREFLDLAAAIPIEPEVEEFPLEEANRALVELKRGRIRGAKVLAIG